MTILPDRKLRKWIYKGGLNPFNIGCVNPASVDLRVNTKHVIRLDGGIVHNSLKYAILPGAPVLLSTVEYIRMPNDCAGVLYLKSSMARQGLDHALAGFIDPGFCGELTMEFHAHYPVTVSHGQRVVQLVLYRLESPPEETYHGKYQNQRGPTRAR